MNQLIKNQISDTIYKTKKAVKEKIMKKGLSSTMLIALVLILILLFSNFNSTTESLLWIPFYLLPQRIFIYEK